MALNGPREHDEEAARRARREEWDAPRVVLTRGDAIEPRAIEWIWPGYLARGKLHILAGRAGVGKTTLALALCATLTRGGRWPDGTRAEPGNVVIWSNEDDPADTLIPRLLANGADVKRVEFVTAIEQGGERRPFDPACDMPALELKAAQIGNVSLVLVDCVVSAVPVTSDSHKNAETRRSLQPLVELCATLRAAGLGITHFSKGTRGHDPVDRVTGSLAFGALPRVVLAAARQRPSQDGGHAQRLLTRAKSNIGPDGGGFEFDVQEMPLAGYDGISASRVLWGQAVDGSAESLLADAEQDEDEQADLADAAEWLKGRLGDAGGTMKRGDIMREAKAAGYPERTIDRARRRLGLVTRVSGFGANRCSEWTLR